MKKSNSNKNLIWDFSLRVFHILLILFIIGSIVSAKYDNLYVHQFFGVAILGLICFRILWGFIGSYYSRFKSFNLSLKEISKQFKTIHPKNSIRTPLGSYSTLTFLIVLLILSSSGLFSSDDILYDGPLVFLAPNYVNFWTYIHNILHYLLYLLIIIHVCAIFYYQFSRKDEIIQRILTGYYKINEIKVHSIKDNPKKGIILLLFFIFLPLLAIYFFN